MEPEYDQHGNPVPAIPKLSLDPAPIPAGWLKNHPDHKPMQVKFTYDEVLNGPSPSKVAQDLGFLLVLKSDIQNATALKPAGIVIPFHLPGYANAKTLWGMPVFFADVEKPRLLY